MLKRTTITMSKDLADWVQAYADRRAISFSAAIRCIVIDAKEMGLIDAYKTTNDNGEE